MSRANQVMLGGARQDRRQCRSGMVPDATRRGDLSAERTPLSGHSDAGEKTVDVDKRTLIVQGHRLEGAAHEYIDIP